MKHLFAIAVLLLCSSLGLAQTSFRGGTGSATDTTSLSARIDLKGNITGQTFVTPTLGVAKATSLGLGTGTSMYPISIFSGSAAQAFNAVWSTNVNLTTAAQAADTSAFTMTFDGSGDPEFKLTSNEGRSRIEYTGRTTITNGEIWSYGVYSTGFLIGEGTVDARSSALRLQQTAASKKISLQILGPDSATTFSVDTTGAVVAAGATIGGVAFTAKLTSAAFADSARANGMGVGTMSAGQLVVAGSADSVLGSTTHTTSTVPLYSAIVPIFSFGLGSGLAGDTTAMTTLARMGGFYWKGPDTLEITSLHIVLSHGVGTDTVTVQVSWDDTAGSAQATLLNTNPFPANSIYAGNEDTSFLNSSIPPGVNVWASLIDVVAGRKPTLITATISGYRKKAL